MSASCWKPKAIVPPLRIVEGKCGMAGAEHVYVNQTRRECARRWEWVHVCGAAHTFLRGTHPNMEGYGGVGGTSSLILLKEDSVGRVAAPQSSCSPHRDTSDTLSDSPPQHTTSHLPTRQTAQPTLSPLRPPSTRPSPTFARKPRFPITFPPSSPPKTQDPILTHSPVPAIHHSKLNLHQALLYQRGQKRGREGMRSRG